LASGHEQWIDAWNTAGRCSEPVRSELQDRLRTVSGELKIGAQADASVRRRALEVIREVRQQARAA
jgi:hypothetical protein